MYDYGCDQWCMCMHSRRLCMLHMCVASKCDQNTPMCIYRNVWCMSRVCRYKCCPCWICRLLITYYLLSAIAQYTHVCTANGCVCYKCVWRTSVIKTHLCVYRNVWCMSQVCRYDCPTPIALIWLPYCGFAWMVGSPWFDFFFIILPARLLGYNHRLFNNNAVDPQN